MDVPRDLLVLVDQALNQACGNIEGGGKLIPFVLHETSDELTLSRCLVARADNDEIDSERSAEHARDFIRGLSGKAERAVAAFDGRYTDDDGAEYDSLYFEAFENGLGKSYVFLQRYRPATADAAYEALGNPMLLREDGPLW
jgi:hypothetical protein